MPAQRSTRSASRSRPRPTFLRPPRSLRRPGRRTPSSRDRAVAKFAARFVHLPPAASAGSYASCQLLVYGVFTRRFARFGNSGRNAPTRTSGPGVPMSHCESGRRGEAARRSADRWRPRRLGGMGRGSTRGSSAPSSKSIASSLAVSIAGSRRTSASGHLGAGSLELVAFAYMMGAVVSIMTLMFDECAYHSYRGAFDRALLCIYAISEQILYRPMNLAWRVWGLVSKFWGSSEWGEMQRSRYTVASPESSTSSVRRRRGR
jgi:hypothetical protein